MAFPKGKAVALPPNIRRMLDAEWDQLICQKRTISAVEDALQSMRDQLARKDVPTTRTPSLSMLSQESNDAPLMAAFPLGAEGIRSCPIPSRKQMERRFFNWDVPPSSWCACEK